MRMNELVNFYLEILFKIGRFFLQIGNKMWYSDEVLFCFTKRNMYGGESLYKDILNWKQICILISINVF